MHHLWLVSPAVPAQSTLSQGRFRISLALLDHVTHCVSPHRAHLRFNRESRPVVEGRSRNVCGTIREHRRRGEGGRAAWASQGSSREDVLLDLTHADVIRVEDRGRRRDLIGLGVLLDWPVGLDDWRHRGFLGLLEHVMAPIYLVLIPVLFRGLLHILFVGLGVIVVVVTAGTPLGRAFLLEGVVLLVQGKLLLKLLPVGSGQGSLSCDVRRVLIFVDGYAFEIGQGRPGVLLF